MDVIPGFEYKDSPFQSAKVEDITIEVGLFGDKISLQQPAEDGSVDTVMLWDVEVAKEVIEKLQTWVDAQ